MFVRIALFLVFMNLFLSGGAVALEEVGVTDTHGINPEPGTDTGEARQAAQQSEEPGGGGLATLFGLYSTLGDFLSTIVNAIPAAATLKAVGVPAAIVDYLYVAQAFVTGLAIMSFFRTGGGI